MERRFALVWNVQAAREEMKAKISSRDMNPVKTELGTFEHKGLTRRADLERERSTPRISRRVIPSGERSEELVTNMNYNRTLAERESLC
jgi:hypothetical protein